MHKIIVQSKRMKAIMHKVNIFWIAKMHKMKVILHFFWIELLFLKKMKYLPMHKM